MVQSKLVTFLRKKNAQFISQIILGVIFIYASVGKILYPNSFANSISNYKILPDFLIVPTAIILPYIELAFGIFLILDVWTKISAIVLSLLLLIFIAAISSTIIRGLNIDCGCFAKFIQETESHNINPWVLILRDILFLIPGFIIIFYGNALYSRKYYI